MNRASLSDFYFIKDNHLGNKEGIVENIKKIKKSKLKKKVTVEIDTIKQLKKILDQEIDIVLLDNMTEKQISQCLKIVKKKVSM